MSTVVTIERFADGPLAPPSPDFLQSAEAMRVHRPRDWSDFESALIQLGEEAGETGFTTEWIVARLAATGRTFPRNLPGSVTGALAAAHRIRAIGRERSVRRARKGATVCRWVLVGGRE